MIIGEVIAPPSVSSVSCEPNDAIENECLVQALVKSKEVKID